MSQARVECRWSRGPGTGVAYAGDLRIMVVRFRQGCARGVQGKLSERNCGRRKRTLCCKQHAPIPTKQQVRDGTGVAGSDSSGLAGMRQRAGGDLALSNSAADAAEHCMAKQVLTHSAEDSGLSLRAAQNVCFRLWCRRR